MITQFKYLEMILKFKEFPELTNDFWDYLQKLIVSSTAT